MRFLRPFRVRTRHLHLLMLLVPAAYLLSQARSAAPFGSVCIMPALPRGIQTATVTRVIDGDTIQVRLGARIAKVRLIGVDAPESSPNEKAFRDASRSGRDVAAIVAMGKEASRFTRGRTGGKTVGLEFDIQRYDRYGRTLAYVWVGSEMLNVVLVREGYAQVMTIPPNVRYFSVFLACEREARSLRRGLWGR